MSDSYAPDDPAAALEVDPDVVFGAADDLRRHTVVPQIAEGLPLPVLGHDGAMDVLGLLVTLLTQLRSSVASEGDTLANAATSAATETMIADYAWTWNGTVYTHNPDIGRATWYGM